MNDFRSEWPRYDECPPSRRLAERKAAIEHWAARVTKHSESDGCAGCLQEAEDEMKQWTQEPLGK